MSLSGQDTVDDDDAVVWVVSTQRGSRGKVAAEPVAVEMR
jgi:hypothetical protein